MLSHSDKKKKKKTAITSNHCYNHEKVLKHFYGGTHKQRWTCVSRIISELQHCVGLGKKELPA